MWQSKRSPGGKRAHDCLSPLLLSHRRGSPVLWRARVCSTLARAGSGSAPLRRQVGKLEMLRAQKARELLVLRRAVERERQVVRAIVGHMRRTASDRLVDDSD